MTDTPENGTGAPPPSDISLISITAEMRKSYLDYAMSVIVSRALPDVRDGLKPVHRRILFSMSENGYEYNKPYRKSARVVGDVIGKYHPHGDSAVYMALVRMAQDFSMGELLVEGQGNFGSVDGDMPAAMRYTEVRMQKITNSMLDDLDKDTVNFRDNYDGSEHEPVVLPARFPNMLVNGGSGIAVGMATNVPTHNLGETIDAALLMLDNPAVLTEELLEVLPGPDFPTGGIILGRAGIRSAYETGRGSVLVRGRVTIEEIRKEREAIIITELPYQVNKATMVEKIAELVREKRIEGIADMRDESSREGMRVVIEIKRDALADVVLNQLYRFTQLQSSFGCNFVALNGGKPQLMNLREMLQAFIDFRHEVVTRRARFLLNKARDRAHILVGLAVAVANIDEVIALIRTAPDPATAREQLMVRRWPAADVEPLIALIDDPRHRINEDGTFNLSEEQARAILELRLARLTALGRDEIGDELNGLGLEIEDYLQILRSRERVVEIIRNELTEIKEQFATPRRTEISDVVGDFDDEDLIAREDMVVTVSHEGYIKRVPLSTYRAQNRGGKGRSGMATRDEDFVSRLFVANTHTPVLFFTDRGIAYKLKVWRLPLAQANARGKALINILPLEQGERLTTIMPLPEDETSWANLDIMFATTRGTVRRNSLADFVEVRQNGKIAMKLDEGDQIVGVETATANNDVLLTTALGQAIRFKVDDVRVFKGRDSMGVRGIALAEGDKVISMAVINHSDASAEERAAYLKMSRAVRGEGAEEEATGSDEGDVVAGELNQDRYAQMSATEQFILTISENGYGKRTSSHEYRITGRGGKGIVAMAVNKRNGNLVSSFPVEDEDQIMLITDGGQTIRLPVGGDKPIRIVSRGSQGVIVFDTADGEKVMSVEHISEPEEAADSGEVPPPPEAPEAPATE
ncbi:MAG: DNA gyrase subunit A [Alphaproteobacteria bacterium]|nr:DNA gyrase subunit A [Alphaproteobacteria bacterium]MBU1561405.1 DNA gyrase subunit A [Alphaproteobacteria bacterium]MBU2302525.1 DNA gyrase subunit A [Alphaproteobacteria bacterium]MBU2367513.1 DNA gyrase subunit A [Alphaproteobacteria bacterium]